jgi:hypothetical protein
MQVRRHHNSIIGLVEGLSIVTISGGATRVFRLSPAKGKGSADFEANDGVAFVVPVGDQPAAQAPRATSRGRCGPADFDYTARTSP